MVLLGFRRGRSSRISRLYWPFVALSLGVLFSVLEVFSVQSSLARVSREPPGDFAKQRIFIASIHWNNEKILRDYWISAVLALAKELGPENVFVSIQESGSWDDSKGALRLLNHSLAEIGVPSKIVLDKTTHLDEISKVPDAKGWIETPRGKTELRRIPYLARLRNQVLQPLYEAQNTARGFDKILFLNDVVFRSSDIRELLSTRGGDYAAVCALDFSKPPAFYDTFALRDSKGHEALMQNWPYFRSRSSRKALKDGNPVPVTGCWNGIVAMDAAPFYHQPRLAFRGIADSLAELHVEGSECCLVHSDNYLSREKGVWLNPKVRVGYNGVAYKAVNPDISRSWVSMASVARGIWTNRILRWFTSPWFKEMVVRYRVRQWKNKHPDSEELGISCLINEMQVLVANGWAHV